MNLQNYVQGERRGKEAHQLERESMTDRFLHDAIEGYDLVDEDPSRRLRKIHKQVNKRSGRKSIALSLQFWSIVACFVGVIGLSAVFLYNKTDALEERAYIENHREDASIFVNYVDMAREEMKTEAADVVAEEKEKVVAVTAAEVKAATEVKTVAEVKAATEVKAAVMKAEVVNAEMMKAAVMKAAAVKAETGTQQKAIVRSEAENKDFGERALSRSRAEESKSIDLSSIDVQAIILESDNRREAAGRRTNVVVAPPPAPAPVVGEQAYNEYIIKNRKELTDSDCQSKHGKIVLLFNVNESGRPVNIAVFRSLCNAADKEAVRLLQNGPDWTANSKDVRWEVVF